MKGYIEMMNHDKKGNIFLIFFLILLMLSSCYHKRDFFQQMNSSLSDVKIDSQYYYIKSFNLSSRPTSINKINYWKLNCSKGSYFFLSGFLRKVNDSIMIVPYNYEKSPFKEYKIFDFNAKTNSSWKIIFEANKDIALGDSIVLLDRRVIARDTICTFSFHLSNFNFYNKRYYYYSNIFNLEVSPKKGIISVAAINHNGAILYKATFYPTQTFVDRRGNLFDL